MRVQHRGYWYGSLLLAVGAGLCSRNLPKPLPSRQMTEGKTERIIDQVEPLCRSIVPDRETLRFIVYPVTLYRKDQSLRHLSMVDCLDAKGKILIHIIWNEDTRHIVDLSHLDYSTSRPLMSPLSSAQAVETARKWILLLDLAKTADVWNNAYKVVKSDDVFRVRLQQREGRVVVWISAKTGQILNTFAHDTLANSSLPPITIEESVATRSEG